MDPIHATVKRLEERIAALEAAIAAKRPKPSKPPAR